MPSICPATCVGLKTCDALIAERAEDGITLTCAWLEHSWSCNCLGCQCGAAFTVQPDPPTTTLGLPTTPTPPYHHHVNYDYSYAPWYYYMPDSDGLAEYDDYYYYSNPSSMLWIIVSVAAVFVIATTILGFLIHRRRRMRMLAMAAHSGDDNRSRAVTEIQVEEVATLPFVERVTEDDGRNRYPVAQTLTVVPSRSNSVHTISDPSSPRQQPHSPTEFTSITSFNVSAGVD